MRKLTKAERVAGVPDIKEALDLAEEAALHPPQELASYDKYWDAISIEKTLLGEAREEGILIGETQG